MERLPPELAAKIAKYLPKEHEGKKIRPALATLSRSWQYAIEQLTFKTLFIKSYDLEDFCTVFSSNTTRHRFLQYLALDIILPRSVLDERARYETADDRAVNNSVFHSSVLALLQELSQWPDGCVLRISIDVYPFMDRRYRDQDELENQPYKAFEVPRNNIFIKRDSQSYIRLTGAFPVTIPCVTSFHAQPGFKHLDPGSLVAMTAAFPKLESIDWPFEDPIYFLALRRQQMQDLAIAVASFRSPALCKFLTIEFHSPWYPHKERLPNFNLEGSSFCSSLCARLGRSNIQRLDYKGPIDPTLFWPQETSEADENLSWNPLQQLEIRFQLWSFEGQWYFKSLPGDPFYDESSDIPLPRDAAGFFPPGYYDSDEQNVEAVAHAKSMEMPTDEEGYALEGSEFRCVPRDEAILPLLTAVGRRLAHTPSLQIVYLAPEPRLVKGGWSFLYNARGQVSGLDKYVDCVESRCRDPASRARIFLHADDDWRPDEGVVALLRGIGRAWNGEDAIFTFLPFFF